VSGADGRAVLPTLPDGTYEVFAYRDGFLPKSATFKLGASITVDRVMSLTVGEVAEATIQEPQLLTPTQLEAAGIDTSLPANRQVKNYQLQLGGSSTPSNINVCVNADDKQVRCPILPNSATQTSGVGSSTGGGGSGGAGSGTTSSYAGGGQVTQVTITKETITYLTMPLDGSFVKDFFQAKMLVHNRAQNEAFVLHDGTAELTVPANLKILSNRYATSSTCVGRRQDPSPTVSSPGWPARVTVSDIPAGGCAEIDWVVRGDTTCSCSVSAAYDAVLAPFERVVRAVTRSGTNFVVYGIEALDVSAELASSDELVAVSGQANTYQVTAGTVIEYKVFARNLTTDRTLRGLQFTYPSESGVRTLGPFASTAQTIDEPINVEIETLAPQQRKEVGRIRLIAKSDTTVQFPAPTARARTLSKPGQVLAPELRIPPYLMSYSNSDRTVRWDPVPGAQSYQLFLSQTDLLSGTPTAVIDAVSVGDNPNWVIPAGSALVGFTIAEVFTATTTQFTGDLFHRPLVRPFADSDCIRSETSRVCSNSSTTTTPGVLTAVITRKPNNANGDRKYEIVLKLVGVRPQALVKFQILEPTPISLNESLDVFKRVSANGDLTVTVTATNPRGVFKAQVINDAATPTILGTVEVK
jgi:hypothetical protein